MSAPSALRVSALQADITMLAVAALTLESVVFCCFSAADLAVHQAELAQRNLA